MICQVNSNLYGGNLFLIYLGFITYFRAYSFPPKLAQLYKTNRDFQIELLVYIFCSVVITSEQNFYPFSKY
jgi:hypothetical protein